MVPQRHNISQYIDIARSFQESEDFESEYGVEVDNSDVDELQSEDEEAPVSSFSYATHQLGDVTHAFYHASGCIQASFITCEVGASAS